MLYVELNPICAAIADTPEAADYTSAHQRVQEMICGIGTWTQSPEQPSNAIPRLLQFTGSTDNDTGPPVALDDYRKLYGCGGRAVHPAKQCIVACNYSRAARFPL